MGGLCDYYGVGYKAARNWWAARYPDSYWIITKVKMTERSKRAWGKLIFKGQVQNEGREELISSVNKREWCLLGTDALTIEARADKGAACLVESAVLAAREKQRALLAA